jgi:hypothetical protein
MSTRRLCYPSSRSAARCSLSRWLSACVAAGALAGCGVDFDPASELSGLRVLAVKKSAPYARPGERVDLTLLWHDTDAGRPPPQIAWLAVCENPPADLFEACFTQVPDLTEAELAARVSLPDPEAATANDRFGFVTASDLISSRPPPADPNTTPYGITYVFFAVCAGQLELDAGSASPFVCYEDLDGVPGFGAADRRRDSRDFVLGYTAIFAYDELRNDNPRVTGIELAGATFWPDSPAELAAQAPPGAILAGPRDVCIGDGCSPPAPSSDAEPCPPELTFPACTGDDCDEPAVELRVDPASAELDAAASARAGETLGEQMWVNYYGSAGELAEEVRLLNDAVEGFSEEVATDYKPTDTAGAAYLWAVAHDNRGGAEWARLRVCTR